MDGSSILMLITSGSSGCHPVFQLLTLLWGSFRAFPQPPPFCLHGVVCALSPHFLWLPGAPGRRWAWPPSPALLSASGFHIHCEHLFIHCIAKFSWNGSDSISPYKNTD